MTEPTDDFPSFGPAMDEVLADLFRIIAHRASSDLEPQDAFVEMSEALIGEICTGHVRTVSAAWLCAASIVKQLQELTGSEDLEITGEMLTTEMGEHVAAHAPPEGEEDDDEPDRLKIASTLTALIPATSRHDFPAVHAMFDDMTADEQIMTVCYIADAAAAVARLSVEMGVVDGLLKPED
jgi:hypothetical protein